MKFIKLSEAEVHYLATLHSISLKKYLENKHGIECMEDIECRVDTKTWKIQTTELSSSINSISDELMEKLK